MEEKYFLSYLRSISGSSDNPALSGPLRERIAEFSSSFPFLDKSASFFYLFNFVQMRYLYVSESIKNIMGYTARDWIDRGPEWVFTTVFSQDVRRLKDVHRALFDYFYSLPVPSRTEYKYVWEVRVVRKDQEVIWLMQQGSFIEIDGDGKPVVTFDVLTDTTHLKKDNVMTLTMFRNADSPGARYQRLPAGARANTPAGRQGEEDRLSAQPMRASSPA